MAIDRFLIAPLSTGLQENVRPWLIADDAFARLQNAYVFRGRVRKRFGSVLMGATQLNSRLAIQVNTTDGAGNAAGNVPGAVFSVGQLFSIGAEIYTVTTAGNNPTLSTGAGNGTYNTANGAYTFAGSPAGTPVFFYPATPVMGLLTYDVDQVDNETLIAFDTQFAYEFNGMNWNRLGTAIWTGTDSQFFWASNWRGRDPWDRILYVTNFNPPDRIKYWDGANWTSIGNSFVIDAANNYIETARIIIQFQNRLLLLNVVENITGVPQSIPNRLRYSKNGTPLDADSWLASPGLGGVEDASTNEVISSAYFIKNRLIVFFESSTWEIVYTNNEARPFIWQKINSELGSESSFSTVPFDKVLLTVGDVGVHACNGANVERIDDKIPDDVFEVAQANNGIARVYGIRDYYVEMVYWTFPSDNESPAYPNQVLVYNYKTGAWAFNDDTITCFGYFSAQSGITWGTATQTWAQMEQAWNSGVSQLRFRNVIAGNQEGFVFLVVPDNARNAPALQITNIIISGSTATATVINHNLLAGYDYVYIENVVGMTNINNITVQVASTPDANTITFTLGIPPVGTYLGGGTLARVSQIDIWTKQFNFYVKEGRDCYVSKVDFLVDSTTFGEIAIDWFNSFSDLSLVTEGSATGALLGTGFMETFPYQTVPAEQTQEMLWHSIYPQVEGETCQLRIYLSDALMKSVFVQIVDGVDFFYPIPFEPFQLHAMQFYAQKTTSRLQ